MRVFTEGRHEFHRVKKALQVLVIEEESPFRQGKISFLASSEAGSAENS